MFFQSCGEGVGFSPTALERDTVHYEQVSREKTMSNNDLMLDVGTANEIKLALRRAGYTNAEVQDIIKGEFLSGVLRIIRGKATIIEKEENVLRLFLDSIPIPPFSCEPILVSEIVNVDGFCRSEDEDFLYWFSSVKTEEMKDTERRLLSCYEVLELHTSTKIATSSNIFSEISERSFTFPNAGVMDIGMVFFLMGQSLATHDKNILSQKNCNLFFVKDVRGVVRLVSANYKNGHWYLRASDAYSSGTAWAGGQRVFCPTFPVYDTSLE